MRQNVVLLLYYLAFINLIRDNNGLKPNLLFHFLFHFTVLKCHQLLRFPLQHDDVIKWKHFPCYWPFVRGIHRSLVNSLHNGQWRRALIFSLSCARINSWVNHHEAGDLRCHHAHYDVIVMRKTNGSTLMDFGKISECPTATQHNTQGENHVHNCWDAWCSCTLWGWTSVSCFRFQNLQIGVN